MSVYVCDSYASSSFLVCLLVCDQISAFGIVLYLRIQRSLFTINCSALWEKFLKSLTRIAPVLFRAALLCVCVCLNVWVSFRLVSVEKTVVCLYVCMCLYLRLMTSVRMCLCSLALKLYSYLSLTVVSCVKTDWVRFVVYWGYLL